MCDEIYCFGFKAVLHVYEAVYFSIFPSPHCQTSYSLCDTRLQESIAAVGLDKAELAQDYSALL